MRASPAVAQVDDANAGKRLARRARWVGGRRGHRFIRAQAQRFAYRSTVFSEQRGTFDTPFDTAEPNRRSTNAQSAEHGMVLCRNKESSRTMLRPFDRLGEAGKIAE